jgi:hypothetical protein
MNRFFVVEIFQSSSIQNFSRWWPRSLIAHIGLELFSYMVMYYIIHLIYRYSYTLVFFCSEFSREAVSEDQQVEFADFVIYFSKNLSPLGRNLAFLLGFYVKQEVVRPMAR